MASIRGLLLFVLSLCLRRASPQPIDEPGRSRLGRQRLDLHERLERELRASAAAAAGQTRHTGADTATSFLEVEGPQVSDMLQSFLMAANRGAAGGAPGGAPGTPADASAVPSRVLEPGAWQRAMAAAPGLFKGVAPSVLTGSNSPAVEAGGGGGRPAVPGAAGTPGKPQGEWQLPLQFFGSSLDTIASHVSSIIGPVPSYNGPCQCKACTAVLQRLRQFMFEWGHFGPKEINEEIDNRFCFGERWVQRSECYFILGNYRDLITTMLYFGMDELSMCQMLFQCYSGKGLNGLDKTVSAGAALAGAKDGASAKAMQNLLASLPKLSGMPGGGGGGGATTPGAGSSGSKPPGGSSFVEEQGGAAATALQPR